MNREYISYLIDVNNASALKRLLQFECQCNCAFDLNATNLQGQTLMHHAAKLQHPNILTVLLELGCDATILDSNGKTCWEYLNATSKVEECTLKQHLSNCKQKLEPKKLQETAEVPIATRKKSKSIISRVKSIFS